MRLERLRWWVGGAAVYAALFGPVVVLIVVLRWVEALPLPLVVRLLFAVAVVAVVVGGAVLLEKPVNAWAVRWAGRRDNQSDGEPSSLNDDDLPF